jgi:hypothetical protein
VVSIYHTTRRNIPEDSHLHIRRRENLKSPLAVLCSPCERQYSIIKYETVASFQIPTVIVSLDAAFVRMKLLSVTLSEFCPFEKMTRVWSLNSGADLCPVWYTTDSFRLYLVSSDCYREIFCFSGLIYEAQNRTSWISSWQ